MQRLPRESNRHDQEILEEVLKPLEKQFGFVAQTAANSLPVDETLMPVKIVKPIHAA